MTDCKTFFLTARGKNLMLQEGREVFADTLHPQTHASFVGVWPSYKLSLIAAWSTTKIPLNITLTWCSLPNPAFSKTAQTTTLHLIILFQACWTYSRCFDVVRSNNKRLNPARSEQFKVVTSPSPRQLYFCRCHGFGFKNGSQPSWNELVCAFEHSYWII